MVERYGNHVHYDNNSGCGEVLGMSKEELRVIYIAGNLHDIGESGVHFNSSSSWSSISYIN